MARCLLCNTQRPSPDGWRPATDDLGQPCRLRIVLCPVHGPRRQRLSDEGESPKRYVPRQERAKKPGTPETHRG